MRLGYVVVMMASILAWAGTVHAQTAVTATCKDGTAFSGKSRSGACSGHGGVKSWGSAAAAPVAAAPAAAPAPTPVTATTVLPSSQPKAKPAVSKPGTGQVWANTDSRVYHCPGSKWFGKTKSGLYMSEPDAIQKGFRADHGKACS